MATKTYFFTGKCKWAKVRKPDEKYNNYQVPLYLTKESWDEFKKSGVQTKIKTDEDGDFTVFKRSYERFIPWEGTTVVQGPPDVFIKSKDGPVSYPDGLIGNGSDVTVKVEVYDGKNGKGHRLVSLLVNELVEYTPPEDKLEMPF